MNNRTNRKSAEIATGDPVSYYSHALKAYIAKKGLAAMRYLYSICSITIISDIRRFVNGKEQICVF